MEGNGGGPEQVGGSQPQGGGLPPPSEEALSAPSQALEEPLSQAAQKLVEPGEPRETRPITHSDASKQQGDLAKEQSSNQPVNMTQVLQQEFGLEPEQLTTLKNLAQKEGINLDQFSEEDLGDKEKMDEILKLLEQTGLNEKQQENLKKIREVLQQADQPLTEEQLQAKINERITQLESRIKELEQKGEQLTPEEQQELNNARKAIEDLRAAAQFSSFEGDEYAKGEAKIERLKQRIKENATYATVGIGLLILVFAWRGFKETSGGQRGGMMG